MFGLFEKKKDPIYSLTIRVDDIADWQYSQSLKIGAQLAIKNGSLYHKNHLIGPISPRLLQYMAHYNLTGAAAVSSLNPFKVDFDLFGAFPDDAPYTPPERDKEYTYTAYNDTAYPFIVPGRQYPCSLVKSDKGYLVVVNEEPIGEITGDDKKIATLARLLNKDGCVCDVAMELLDSSAKLRVGVRF